MKKIINNENINNNFKKRIIKLFKIYCFFLIIILIFSIIYGFLIHNEIISITNKSFDITSFIIGIICFFILGIITGLASSKNGFLDAFIASLIIILLSLILNLFIKNNYDYMTFIKGFIFILVSSLGGIIGIKLNHKNQ